MKYLKRYNKIFESKSSKYYYIKGNYWDYELGYIFSPNLRTSSYYRDPSVVELQEKRDGYTSSLIGESLGWLFSEYMGKPIKDLCEIYLKKDDINKEFSFIKDSLLDKKYYVIVESPENKKYLVKEFPAKDMKKDYKDLIRDVIGRDFTDEEISDFEEYKGMGSWHATVCFYETNGIKYLSKGVGDNDGFVFRRDDIEDILDMTNSCNYYRFKDKEEQLLRISDKRIKFMDISDIFMDLVDVDVDRISFDYFAEIGPGQLMVKFMKDDAQFNDEFVVELEECIKRFENTYSCKFERLDLTRNHMMYINDSNKTFLLKDRPVMNFIKLNDLAEVGEMEYDVHLRPHAIYLIFNF